MRAVLGAVFDFAAPDLTMRDRIPQIAEEIFAMEARIDDVVGVADELCTGILGYRAEAIVDIGDAALSVGDGDNGVLVDGGLELGELVDRIFELVGVFFELGDVAGELGESCQLPRRGIDGREGAARPELCAVFAHAPAFVVCAAVFDRLV